MIRAVFFDWGNTLVAWEFDHALFVEGHRAGLGRAGGAGAVATGLHRGLRRAAAAAAARRQRGRDRLCAPRSATLLDSLGVTADDEAVAGVPARPSSGSGARRTCSSRTCVALLDGLASAGAEGRARLEPLRSPGAHARALRASSGCWSGSMRSPSRPRSASASRTRPLRVGPRAGGRRARRSRDGRRPAARGRRRGAGGRFATLQALWFAQTTGRAARRARRDRRGGPPTSFRGSTRCRGGWHNLKTAVCQVLRRHETCCHDPGDDATAFCRRHPPSCRCGRRTRSNAVAVRCIVTRSSIPVRASSARAPFVYAYEAFGHTYMGCMQRVFDVEIDLDLLRAAERRRDGFGAVVARRAPLPMCHAEVESCYEQRGGRGRLPQPRVLRDPGSARRASASSRSCRLTTAARLSRAAAREAAPARAGRRRGVSLPSAWRPPRPSRRAAPAVAPARPRPARARPGPASRGSPAAPGRRGGRGTCAGPSPISPRPTDSWRSRFEPSSAFESLTCRHRRRSSPILRVEVGDRRVERGRIGDVDPRCVPVAGVEADPETWVMVERVVDRGQLVRGAADRAAGAGRVLHQEPEVVGRQLEQLVERGNRPARGRPRARRRGESRRGR